MAASHKITLFFNQGLAGWSESWYVEGVDHDDALDIGRKYAKDRVELLGAGPQITYLRSEDLAVDGSVRHSFLGMVNTLPDLEGAAEFDQEHAYAVTPGSAYLVNIITKNNRQRSFHIRGLPDKVIHGDAYGGLKDVEFKKPYANWVKFLKDNLQVRTKKSAAEGDTAKVTAVTVADGRATLTLNQALFALGDNVTMYGFKGENHPRGEKEVLAVSGNTIEVHHDGSYVYNQEKNAKVTKVEYTYHGIEAVSQRRATIRATGRPFDQRRGRRRANR